MDGTIIDKLGKIVGEYLWSNEVQMLLTMPKGSMDVEITDNTDLGGIVQFVILLNAIKPIAANIREENKIDITSEDWKTVADGMLELVRNELMEG